MKKIILVDDDPDILKMLGIILGKQYEVHPLSNADELEEKIRTVQPHLLILDNVVEEENSATIVERLRRTPQLSIPPIVLHSGTPDIGEQARQIQAAGYISKPAAIQRIKDYIDHIMS